MNLCNDGHDEICYEGRKCPACVLKDENEELRSEVDRLKEQSWNRKRNGQQ